MTDTDGGSPPPWLTDWVKEFAWGCKAAARTVALYPAEHPVTAAALGRIVALSANDRMPGPLRLTVVPRGLLHDGMPVSPGDSGVSEFADLLHHHHVGEFTIHPDGGTDAWYRFLTLLSRDADAVRRDGGIAKSWGMLGGVHVDLREIDYSDLLKERSGGESTSWELIVSNYLEGDSRNLGEDTIQALARIAETPGSLAKFVGDIDSRSHANFSVEARTAAIVSVLRGLEKCVVSYEDDDRREAVWQSVCDALAQLSPEVVVGLSTQRGREDVAGVMTPDVVADAFGQSSDAAVAGFVSRNVARYGAASRVLVEAFQALVPDLQRRHDVLSLAYVEATSSGLALEPDFEARWASATASLILDSYAEHVSEDYGRDLSSSHHRAREEERITDDPPARIATWLETVEPDVVTGLDVMLMIDLLEIERDLDKWTELMPSATSLVENLVLAGEFEPARAVVSALEREKRDGESAERRAVATDAVGAIATGRIVSHLTSQLAGLNETEFARVTAFCLALGDALVRPLFQALTEESAQATRSRLIQLLVAFGQTARQVVDTLKASPDPEVRRTAVYLLYELGGHSSLPALAKLLDDSEAEVQREAARAIVNIGTDRAHHTLREILARGSEQSREAILHALGEARDEQMGALLLPLLKRVSHTGRSSELYCRLVELLARCPSPGSVQVLKEVLHRGEWWAPVRTARLRRTAARALAIMATPDALSVLETSARHGSRGIRAAARIGLAKELGSRT